MAGAEHRFYGDFAEWWPLISPVADYEEEVEYAAGLLTSGSIPVHDVLELGSGGGNNAAHLKRRFSMTLVDLSPQMLEVSRPLNPECDHVEADMRTVRLGRTFDAVFAHDAIDYMATEWELGEAIETAWVHCRPGGAAVFMPDHTAETFMSSSDHGGSDAPDGRGARYLEWSWDPDPTDHWITTDYSFVFRSADGATEVVHETHRTGLFSEETWLRLLTEAGFEPRALTEETTEDRRPRRVFVALRPA
ncbi:MAG: class I SAM-dependent methyltransferase [Ilumatobacteraceae bacterium]